MMADRKPFVTKKDGIFIGLIAVVVIGVLMATFSWYKSSGGGVDIRILNLTAQTTDTGFLGLGTVHYVASGQIQNQGALTSGTIQLQFTVTSDQGTILYTTFINPTPSTLGAGQTGIFSIPFSTDDLAGYKGNIHYQVKVTLE